MKDSLGALGVFLIGAGFVCLTASSRELPALGPWLIAVGVVLLAIRSFRRR